MNEFRVLLAFLVLFPYNQDRFFLYNSHRKHKFFTIFISGLYNNFMDIHKLYTNFAKPS